MEFVVDTSVIIAVLVNEPQRRALIRITQGAHLLAPPSVPWEVGNAFAAMIKRKRLTVTEALEAIVAYRQIPLRLVEVELDEAVRVAGESGIYAYDAYLIRCAQKYKAPLISLDRELAGVAERLGVDVVTVEG